MDIEARTQDNSIRSVVDDLSYRSTRHRKHIECGQPYCYNIRIYYIKRGLSGNYFSILRSKYFPILSILIWRFSSCATNRVFIHSLLCTLLHCSLIFKYHNTSYIQKQILILGLELKHKIY
jgi:hypothetical protein